MRALTSAKGQRAIATTLAILGAWLLISSAVVLVEAPWDEVLGGSNAAGARVELVITFTVVFVPGAAMIAAAIIKWIRSEREFE
jgi:hypothetical protein